MATSLTLDVIAQRYSCRAFADTPLPNDVLDAIIKAGLQAPSARNLQPWLVWAIRDAPLLAEIEAAGIANLKIADPAGYERVLGRGGTIMYHAPVVVIIASPDQGNPYSDIDCGILTAHIVLAATSLGVDSCIAGMVRNAFESEAGPALRERIGIPNGYSFNMSVLLGYASGDAKPGHEIDASKASII